MDRFLKRTEHHVSPVLSAPKKPKVSSKQGVISASFRAQGVGVNESGDKLFCKSCNLVIDHHRKFVINSKV